MSQHDETLRDTTKIVLEEESSHHNDNVENHSENENHHQIELIKSHHYDHHSDSDEVEEHEMMMTKSTKRIQFLSMLWDVAYNMTIVGSTSFRGGVVQLMARFCEKTKWLTENEFMEVYVMSHIVPGPKPSQIAMALAMPKYGFSGGILSYFFFSIPGFIVCLILGLSMYDYDSAHAPNWFIHAQKGLACSGIAFALQSMSRFSSMLDNETKKKKKTSKEEQSKKKKPEMFPYILLTIVAMITLLYRKTWLLPVLLVIGAIISIIYCNLRDGLRKRIEEFGLLGKLNSKSYEDLKFKQKFTFFKLFIQTFIPKYAKQLKLELAERMEENGKEESPSPSPLPKITTSTTDDSTIEEESNNPFAKMASVKLGICLVLLFIILLGCLTGASLIVESTSPTVKLSNNQERRKINLWTEWIIVSSFFFKSGSLIFNGAVVNVVIIRDEMIERGWMTNEQFINGYSLTNAAPGPRFNLGFYFGSVIAGNLLNSNYTDALYNSPTNNSSITTSTITMETATVSAYPPISSRSSNNYLKSTTVNNEMETTDNNDSISPFTKIIVAIAYSMVAGISFHAPGFILILAIVPLWGSLRSKPIVQKAMNGINAVCVGYFINNIVILWISVVGTSVPLAAVSILAFALVNWIDFWHPMVVFVGAFAAVLIGLIVPI